MKLSVQEELGLRCLVQMARCEPGSAVTVEAIAEREGLSSAYVAKLMRQLRQADLVRSIRGQKGGYELVRSAESMNLGEIIEALGGRLYAPERCRNGAEERPGCAHDSDCSLRPLWVGIDRVVFDLLSRCKLSDLPLGEKEMERWIKEQTGSSRKPG